MRLPERLLCYLKINCKKYIYYIIIFQTFVPLAMGVGLAFITFGRRKKRSLDKEESVRVLNLDLAQAELENNIEAFLNKFHIENLK